MNIHSHKIYTPKEMYRLKQLHVYFGGGGLLRLTVLTLESQLPFI